MATQNPPSPKVEELIRKMRREGRSWTYVNEWIIGQGESGVDTIVWARRIYNDEATREQK